MGFTETPPPIHAALSRWNKVFGSGGSTRSSSSADCQRNPHRPDGSEVGFEDAADQHARPSRRTPHPRETVAFHGPSAHRSVPACTCGPARTGDRREFRVHPPADRGTGAPPHRGTREPRRTRRAPREPARAQGTSSNSNRWMLLGVSRSNSRPGRCVTTWRSRPISDSMRGASECGHPVSMSTFRQRHVTADPALVLDRHWSVQRSPLQVLPAARSRRIDGQLLVVETPLNSQA